jgi:hypothetical protein
MHFPLLPFALLFAGLTGTLHAAPPANDSFATRALVTTAGATGTNVEATTEPGEPCQRPDGACAGTVWWSFTAPASGWYEVNTAGSGFDTVLNVYQGTDWSSLVRLAAADDDALDENVNTSRVRFQAVGGEVYAFQAGSFSQVSQGPVTLSVQPIAEPVEHITFLSFSPAGPYDVSAAAQNVTLTFTLKQNASLDYGTITMTRPDGGLLREWEFTAAQRISGSATEGTYQVPVILPRYAAAGNYPLGLTGWSVDTGAPPVENGGWAWTSLPASITPHFSLTNPGVADVTAPALAEAAFSQPSVDVTSAGVVVPLTLRLTDDLSGFVSGTVALEQIVNATHTDTLAAGTLAAVNRTSGSAMDGQYLVQFFVPQNAPAGLWPLRCELTDSLGNKVSVLSSATLTVSKNPWPAWVQARALTGLDALPDADPDHDGLPNLQEFAFHTDPKQADLRQISPLVPERAYRFRGATPYEYTVAGEWRLRYIRRRGANAGSLTSVPLFSGNLTDWTAATELTITPFSAEWEMVEARDPAGAGSRRFGKVLLNLP